MLGEILSGAQAAIGIGQTIAGLVQKKPEIPDYQIPQQVYENMTDAEYWSFQGLPESQKQSFIERSQRGTATALSRTSDRKGGLGMVAGAAQTEQDASMDLLNADVTQRMNNLQTFWGMRDKMASEERTKQEWNMNKVMDKRNKIDELRGSGMQNIMGSLGTAAGLDAYSEDGLFGDGGFLSNIFGGKGKQSTTVPGSTSPGSISQPNGGFIRQNKSYDPNVKRDNNLGNLLAQR